MYKFIHLFIFLPPTEANTGYTVTHGKLSSTTFTTMDVCATLCPTLTTRMTHATSSEVAESKGVTSYKYGTAKEEEEDKVDDNDAVLRLNMAAHESDTSGKCWLQIQR